MLLSSLPQYSGPFKVACRDIEYLKGAQMLFQVESEIKPKDVVSPLLVRLYYPAEIGDNAKQANWAPFPSNRYMRGLPDYAKIPSYISSPLLGFFGGEPKQGAVLGTGSEISKAQEKYPTVIFSHGLAGSRTFYSGICGELASFGFLVCAIEHRDHSAAYSYTTSEPSNMSYIHAPGDESDPKNMEFRRSQLKFRVGEVELAHKLLSEINSASIQESDLTKPNLEDSEVKILGDSDWWFKGLSFFKNKLDLDNCFLVGHSFGGATCLETLKNPENPFKASVVYDPWMYAVKATHITRPILAINSQGFTNWKLNFDSTKDLLKRTSLELGDKQGCHLVTLPNTEHTHQSDVPSLVNLAFKFFGSKVDSPIALSNFSMAGLSYLYNSLPVGTIPKLDDDLELFTSGSKLNETYTFSTL